MIDAHDARCRTRKAVAEAADPEKVKALQAEIEARIVAAADKGNDRVQVEVPGGPSTDEVLRQLEESEFFLENTHAAKGKAGAFVVEISW